jgi:hypothetical protein
MGRSALLLLVGLACFGCSTLPSRYASPDDEEAGIVDVKEYVASGDGKAAQAAPLDAPPPGTEAVAWEDNGIPIRQLTGDGPPQEMKLPANDMKKKPGFAPKAAASTQTPTTLPTN